MNEIRVIKPKMVERWYSSGNLYRIMRYDIGCIALIRWNMIVQISRRHMDRVVRDVIRCMSLSRMYCNVQVTCINMNWDVISSLLGKVREVKIIVKHIITGMIVRIVWEESIIV